MYSNQRIHTQNFRANLNMNVFFILFLNVSISFLIFIMVTKLKKSNLAVFIILYNRNKSKYISIKEFFYKSDYIAKNDNVETYL